MDSTQTMAQPMPKFKIPEKLEPLLRPKKFKVIYGGRGGAKSMTVADILLMRMVTEGIKIGAMREHQNSIDDSVHSLFCAEIERLGLQGFNIQATSISHSNGAMITYKGLSRNPESVKSMHGFHVFWAEEAGTLSKKSIDLLIPTLREEGSELWMTFNPGSSADPVCQEFLKPFEKELMKSGYYEDDMHSIIRINYEDNPFFPDNLNQLRLKHKETKSDAEYDHTWLGHYSDEVSNSIIKTSWFDAAIDAHKLDRLKEAFKPHGARVAAHDPSDTGNDAKGYSLRHGSIFEKILAKDTGEIDEGCDWATGMAINDQADWFVWDGDGMGAGLKRQVSIAFNGKPTKYHMFRGSLSGIGQDNAESIYMPTDEDKPGDKPKTYAETFKNNRAQYSWLLRDRFYNTYRCVAKGEYVDPADMISIDSDGVLELQRLRSEVCRIPRKENNTGLIQIMSKQEMKRLDIDSPNMYDSIMMNLYQPTVKKIRKALPYASRGTV